MSRIGHVPITVPSGVDITVTDGNFVEVKGKNGTLSKQIDKDLTITVDENSVVITRPTDNKRHKSMHGLSRTLVENMIIGVTDGYSKTLEIEGTGYRAAKEGNKLILTLGFSHPIELTQPEGLNIEVPENNKIIVSGADKQKVGNFAAVVRDFRKPEPYKGKGVRYQGEQIRRKVGKAGS